MSTFISTMSISGREFVQTVCLKCSVLIGIFQKKSLTVIVATLIKRVTQMTLNRGFTIPIYLSGGLLNLIKSVLALWGFAFSVSLLVFSLLLQSAYNFLFFIFIGISRARSSDECTHSIVRFSYAHGHTGAQAHTKKAAVNMQRVDPYPPAQCHRTWKHSKFQMYTGSESMSPCLYWLLLVGGINWLAWFLL